MNLSFTAHLMLAFAISQWSIQFRPDAKPSCRTSKHRKDRAIEGCVSVSANQPAENVAERDKPRRSSQIYGEEPAAIPCPSVRKESLE